MAEVESRSPGDNAANSSVLARQTAICLFAFAECADALRPRLPDATIERRLMLHCVGRVAALVGVVPIDDYHGVDSERCV